MILDEGAPGATSSGEIVDDRTTDYVYDRNGNLLMSDKYSQSCFSNSRIYTYNAWGQLTSFSDSLGGSGSYSYYADGLRKLKTAGDDTIKYYYNGDTVINETKNGSEYATNVTGVDGMISRRVNGYASYYYKDGHGSVVYGFTEGKWRSYQYDYTAWGEPDAYDYYAPSNPNPIQYCGEYHDAESGLIYLRGRCYSSELRRFISEDPAKDGVNWYAYCGNNPVMYADPSGYGPGDRFYTMDEAAVDFGKYINAVSIRENVEYGALIYSYRTTEYEWHANHYYRTTKTIYSYTNPFTDNDQGHINYGTPHEYIKNNERYIREKAAVRGDSEINNIAFEATAHTHGAVQGQITDSVFYDAIRNDPDFIINIAYNKDIFSAEDINTADTLRARCYLATPTGKMRVYNPNALLLKERTISYSIPKDPVLYRVGYKK